MSGIKTQENRTLCNIELLAMHSSDDTFYSPALFLATSCPIALSPYNVVCDVEAELVFIECMPHGPEAQTCLGTTGT